MKNYKKDIEGLSRACKDFLDCVKELGNECAWTDRKLEHIIELSSAIKEKYEKDGGVA